MSIVEADVTDNFPHLSIMRLRQQPHEDHKRRVVIWGRNYLSSHN